MATRKSEAETVGAKAEAVMEAEKKPAVRRAAAAKKPAVKTEEKATVRKTSAEKKADMEKPAEKKPAAGKTEPKESVMIQYGAREAVIKDVVAAAVNAYKAAHKDAEIKTVEVYVKPEENAAYYVVNGDDSEGNNKIELF